MPEDLDIDANPSWNEVMELRVKTLKALEETKDKGGVSNPLDAGIEAYIESELYNKLKPFEAELADLTGISRFSLLDGDNFKIVVKDLSGEPRCERSWKRDGTVKERSDGGFLSDRDAEAIGLR